MVSKETGDIYSTNEPQTAFNSRIAFCLNMHNEARAMRRGERGSSKRKSWLSIWLRKTMMISRERSSVRTLFLAAHNLTFLLCPSF
ncbi:BnaCnng26770D [Brassica napus]|uniref:BnaCnng26770D protein n=1 Tax=Brassica napus TaxID=3708 RepID=A0A078IWF1_BRANA|nr:BnaCnng26770D [Brassica napus]